MATYPNEVKALEVDMADDLSLNLSFLDHVVLATDGLGFGRHADLVVDAENLYLHGTVGRFHLTQAGWSLHNVGTLLHIKLGNDHGTIIELPPGDAVALPSGEGFIRIKAGPASYEVRYTLSMQHTGSGSGSAGTGTLPYGRSLTPAQLDYALTLAEPRLKGWTLLLPTYAEIAARWGVSERAVSRAFEDIRARLRDAGVRRISAPEQLVEYLVVNRLVTLSQLQEAQLESPNGPRRRAEIDKESKRAH